MFPSLLVAATVMAPGAPLPKDVLPNATGPAPRITAVKADASGTVWITATVSQKRKVTQHFFVIENGKQVLKQQEQEVMTSVYVRKSLGDFGGKLTTAEGLSLTADEATRRVKGGATILITADGQPIDKGWLQTVSADTVVLYTNELAHAHFQYGNVYAMTLPQTSAPRLARLCTDDNGTVRLPVNPHGANQAVYNDFGGVGGGRFRGRMVVVNGNLVPADGGSSSTSFKPADPDGKKSLENLRFDAYDLTGKLVSRTAALKRLKAGGLVLLAGDNRFPDSDYLKAFRNDVLVLVSPELVFPSHLPNPYDLQVKPVAAPQPAKTVPGFVPAIQPPLPPVAPPVGRIQVRPGIIRRGPAVPPVPQAPPAPAAKPQPKPAEKPATK